MRKVRKVRVSTKFYTFKQGIMLIWCCEIPYKYTNHTTMRFYKRSKLFEQEINRNFRIYQNEKREK